MLGGSASREARDRQIARTPEEVNRARLADKARPENLEHTIGLDERSPESMHVLSVVRAMRLVLGKRDRIDELRRLSRDAHLDVEAPQRFYHQTVKHGDTLCTKWNLFAAALTRSKLESMCCEIELQLERPSSVRNRRRGQPSRRDVESRVPGMIEPRRLDETDLPDDLRPEMQGGEGILPRGQRKVRPCGCSFRHQNPAAWPSLRWSDPAL